MLITIEQPLATHRRRALIRASRAASTAASIGIIGLFLTGCSAGPNGLGEFPFASREEIAQATADCLADKGWDVTVSEDGGIGWEGEAVQYDQYFQALQECRGDTGAQQANEDFVVTDDMLHEAYQLQVDTLDCLREEGYNGLSDPPSLQAYLDSRGAWTPYSELPAAISEADWIALQKTCPQPQINPVGE